MCEITQASKLKYYIGPPMPDSEVLFGEANSFWTAVSPLSSLGEVEEGCHNGLFRLGGGAGDHGGFQGVRRGIGIVPDNGISQLA